MSTPSVHFEVTSDSSDDAILVIEQDPPIIKSLSSLPISITNGPLKQGEVFQPMFDLEASATVLKMV
jgi:hypothetical protein